MKEYKILTGVIYKWNKKDLVQPLEEELNKLIEDGWNIEYTNMLDVLQDRIILVYTLSRTKSF